jgi:hypothetical protein
MKKTYRKKKAIRRKRYSRRSVKKYYKGGDQKSIPIFFIRKNDPCNFLNQAQCNEKCYLVHVGRVQDVKNFEYLRRVNIGDRYIKYNILGINPNQANPERISIITYDYDRNLWKGEVFDKNLVPIVFYMEPDDKYMMPINDSSDSTKAEITEEWRRQLRVERPQAARSDQRSDYNAGLPPAIPVTPEKILLTKLQDNTPNIKFKCNVEVLNKGVVFNSYKLKTYTTSAETIKATSIDVTVESVELIEIYKNSYDVKKYISMTTVIPTKKAYKMFCVFSGSIINTKFKDKDFCLFDGEKFLFKCMQYTGKKINTIADYSNQSKDYHSDLELGPFPCPTNIQIN